MIRNCSPVDECKWENSEYTLDDGSKKYCCASDYCNDQGMYEEKPIHCYTCPGKICRNNTVLSECMPGLSCNVNN